LEVLFKSGFQFRVRRRRGHFRQRFHELVLGAVEVFQFVVEQVFEGIEFHGGVIE
jgi:hypothetical protein